MSLFTRTALVLGSLGICLTLVSCTEDLSRTASVELVTTDLSGDVVMAKVGIRLTGSGVTASNYDANLSNLAAELTNEFNNSLFSLNSEVPKQLTDPSDLAVSSISDAVSVSFDNVLGNLNGFNNGTYGGSISSVQLINTNEFAQENWNNFLATLPEGSYEQPSLAPDNDLPGAQGWGFATASYKDVQMSEDLGTPYYQYLAVNTLKAGAPKPKAGDMAKQEAKLQKRMNDDTTRQLQLMQGEAAIEAARNQQPGIIYPGNQVPAVPAQ